MAVRAAEWVQRRGLLRRPVLVRADLHGVSVVAGADRTALRWEWVRSVAVEEGRVVLSAGRGDLALPPGAFGLTGETLAALLRAARAVDRRPEVLAALAAACSPRPVPNEDA